MSAATFAAVVEGEHREASVAGEGASGVEGLSVGRPGNAPEIATVAGGGMECVQRGGVEQVDAVLDLFEDREVVIHDRIDEGVGEKVRLVFPDLRACAVDPLPDGIEHVARLLLKSDEPAGAKHDAQLLVADFAVLLVEFEHLERQEEVALEILDLRALAGVQNVLQRQRIDAEQRSKLFDHAGIMQPGDIDPEHRELLLQCDALRRTADGHRDRLLFTVADDGDFGLLDLLLADMDERTRRLADRLVTAVEHLFSALAPLVPAGWM